MNKARLSMETFRKVDRLFMIYSKGKITASKGRALLEAILHDKLDLESLDPIELGASDTERVHWALSCKKGEEKSPEQISLELGMDRQRAAESCSRLARRGRATRTSYGVYRRGP